ncbi:MAG: ABC-2 transporter permease [Clostridiales bacterium]|nr:ABC-2 transporter permease [Clostridiales bacterium]
MMRLIYKDLKAYYHIIVFQTLIILLMMSFGIFIDHNGTLTILMLIIYPMTLPFVLLLNDTKYERLALSLPINRYQYVFSKYLGGFIFAFLIIVVGLLYSYIISSFKASIDFDPLYSITGFFILCFPVVVISSVLFPVYFRFSKSMASGIIILMLAIILIGLIVGLVYLEKTLETSVQYSKEDIFPVITSHITNYIISVGPNTFQVQVIISVCTLLTFSIGMSLLLISKKDIGDPS